MRRPRLLDLYCGGGGAGKGYELAGFDVTGVDINPQPRYPFPFVQADAIEYCARHGREFDFIHASPPCQAYTRSVTRAARKAHPDLIARTRAGLIATGRPWVIENVPGAPLQHYITLCGGMFGLRTYRHRRFETSFAMWQPMHPPHTTLTSKSEHERHWREGWHIVSTGNCNARLVREAMGIDWMTGKELSQAIPPAYTRFIGESFLGGAGATIACQICEGETQEGRDGARAALPARDRDAIHAQEGSEVRL